MAILWVLNQANGQHDLLDIAERSGLKFEIVAGAAAELAAADVIRKV
jgi:aminopeptidase-like protein